MLDFHMLERCSDKHWKRFKAVGDNNQELIEYRQKVVAEVQVRALKVQEIEVEIARVDAVVKELRDGMVLRGQAGMGQVREAHLRVHRQRCEALQAEFERAVADLARAERRLVEVDERIEEEALIRE
jgi:hypothetical protein